MSQSAENTQNNSNSQGSQKRSIAVVGATGAVGMEFLDVLNKLEFPIKEIKLLASKRSAGKEIEFRGEKLVVEEARPEAFDGVEIALFSAGSSITKALAPEVTARGCKIVDNSSAFRMDPEVPLVIPEINPQDIAKDSMIIANPNCSTIILLMALFPIYRRYRVRRVVVSTYQAASGAGWAAMDELERGARAYLDGKEFTPEVLPHPYAFNTFSHNSAIDESGYNEEERKMVRESKKILHDSDISITATCVRVPVMRAHSESINIEFYDETPNPEEARQLLGEFPGVRVVDDVQNNKFPMPVDASGSYDCLVGRIRRDISQPEKGLDLFISGDQLLKGAALNAVQIAQLL